MISKFKITYIFTLIMLTINNKGLSEDIIYIVNFQEENHETHLFKHYNSNINDSIINTFNLIIDLFELNEHKEKLIAQICLESSANHFNKDSVLKSSGNALGIAQITPYTAELFIENIFKYNDTILFKIMNYNNILEADKDKKRELIINLLSNLTNNLYIYGYMMKYQLDRYKDIDIALCVYAYGDNFVLKSDNINELDYLTKINEILNIKSTNL